MARKPQRCKYLYDNTSILWRVCKQTTGLSDKALIGLIFGYYHTKYLTIITDHPRSLTVAQLFTIGGILEGKYSLPLLFALAAGYRFDSVPLSWLDDPLPPIPPQLEAMENVVMKKREYNNLKNWRDKQKESNSLGNSQPTLE
mgnify:CR=1 FL=1